MFDDYGMTYEIDHKEDWEVQVRCWADEFKVALWEHITDEDWTEGV